jgi:hypothetical protein
MNLAGETEVQTVSLSQYVIENIFLLHYTQVLCQYRLCRADHACLTHLMLQRQLSHLNGRKLDHLQL